MTITLVKDIYGKPYGEDGDQDVVDQIEYEVEFTYDDITRYIMGDKFNAYSREEQKAIYDYISEENAYGYLDYLYDDNDFKEYLKELYPCEE